jgi:DNA-binding NtrC family response regulator
MDVPRPTILVVDDELALRLLLETALRRHGFVVRLAAGGREALAAYRQEPSELVLMDLRMPDGDGLETLEALRALDPQVRCCLMSGDLGENKGADLLLRGALHTFQKPFVLRDLIATLWRLLQVPALRISA